MGRTPRWPTPPSIAARPRPVLLSSLLPSQHALVPSICPAFTNSSSSGPPPPRTAAPSAWPPPSRIVPRRAALSPYPHCPLSAAEPPPPGLIAVPLAPPRPVAALPQTRLSPACRSAFGLEQGVWATSATPRFITPRFSPQ